jgi:hypothetical protein
MFRRQKEMPLEMFTNLYGTHQITMFRRMFRRQKEMPLEMFTNLYGTKLSHIKSQRKTEFPPSKRSIHAARNIVTNLHKLVP